MREDLRGKRYIAQVRASDDADGTTSTEAQLAWLKEYAQRIGMICVDEVILDGLTGSLPGRREDLQRLLDRKREKNDFDVLLVQRVDRLTRSGSGHGFWFEHECRRAGLLVIFPGDDIPAGRYGNLIKVAKYEAAQEQAFSISQRSTQGRQLALEQGRNATGAHTPYGCWRLYLTSDGRPSHIIRDLGDGRQLKLDPETHETIDTYGRVGGRSKGHYRKQKDERVLYIPGDPEKAAIVREIFELHFVQGWGGKRIADLLNRRGVPSSQGRAWSQHQVEVIYEQASYTGRSVGNCTSSAIYHECHAKAPKRVNLDPALLATAKNIPVRQRPFDEWFIQDQPLMVDFLDPKLRKLAMAAHERLWKLRGDPDRPRQSKSKHNDSDYLLTGLLFAKQDGEPLVGILCGRVGSKVRYYRHRRGRRAYVKGSIFNRMVNSESLERAVLKLVQEILASESDLRDRIVRCINDHKGYTKQDKRLTELHKRRERVKKRTELIVSTLDEDTLADARIELDRLRMERRTLDEQIAAAEAASRIVELDPQTIADNILAKLSSLAANRDEMPRFALRQLLATVINRLVVDMVTMEVEVEMLIPILLGIGDSAAAEPMRLVGSSASSTSYETHHGLHVPLGNFGCSQQRNKGRLCYVCRRKAA